MEVKDFVFSSSPEVLCQSLLTLSGKFHLHDGPFGMCIATSISPSEYDERTLRDILKAVDLLVLPQAQKMVRETSRPMDTKFMAEIFRLAFADVVATLRETHNIPQEIPLPTLLK